MNTLLSVHNWIRIILTTYHVNARILKIDSQLVIYDMGLACDKQVFNIILYSL